LYIEFLEKLKDFFYVFFLTDILDWIESGKVAGLRNVEKELLLSYFVKFTPIYYFLEKKWLKHPENNFFFGEVPYAVSKDIVEVAGINKEDAIYDLGCGRGKFLFFMNLFTGARCIGFDLLPVYIKTATKIIEKLKLRRIDFFKKDFLDVDLSSATVVFAHGTTFSMETHHGISDNIRWMKPGSRFISVSIGYDHPCLELMEKKKYFLSWGQTTIFFYKVKKADPSINESQPSIQNNIVNN